MPSVWNSIEDHHVDLELFPSWSVARIIKAVESISNNANFSCINQGETIALTATNSVESVLAILALLKANARALLLGHDIPEKEQKRIYRDAGARKFITITDRLDCELIELEPPYKQASSNGILICSSGSTGLAKVVFRSEISIVLEAHRYINLLNPGVGESVILPMPISHAYALGWLFANIIAGVNTILLPTTAFNEIDEHIHQSTTIVLSPSIARLLSLRKFSIKAPSKSSLKLAMVGAGPVDQHTDSLFKKKYGIPLARNYGSTETGALFSGLPPLPYNSIGQAMPGISYKIETIDGVLCSANQEGLLWVKDSSNHWHCMGDLCYTDPQGNIIIIGRLSQSIRRGERWVSPLEIESILRQAPNVHDLHVQASKGRTEGTDQIIVEVVPIRKPDFCVSEFINFAKDNLAPYKIPDIVNLKSTLQRSENGKIKKSPVYCIADSTKLTDAARAYKQSVLIFALHKSGILDQLDGKKNVSEIASNTGVQEYELELLLKLCTTLGLIEEFAPPYKVNNFVPTPFLELEILLSGDLVSTESVIEVLEKGIEKRCFDHSHISSELIDTYTAAMHGPHSRFRILNGLRQLKCKNNQSLLEVTVGSGTYIQEFVSLYKGKAGLIQLGKLSDRESHTKSICDWVDESALDVAFDFCVVNNAIHGPHPANSISWLLERLKPNGKILIDDIFLPEEGTENVIGLDWFTHGGVSHMRLSQLELSLLGTGCTYEILNIPNDPLHKLIIIEYFGGSTNE